MASGVPMASSLASISVSTRETKNDATEAIVDVGRPASPWSQAGQSAEQAVAALGRYADGFVRRHTPPADPAPWTLRRWRHPR